MYVSFYMCKIISNFALKTEKHAINITRQPASSRGSEAGKYIYDGL